MLELWKTVVGEYEWAMAAAHNEGIARAITRTCEEVGVSGQGSTYPKLTHVFEERRYDAIDIRPALPLPFWAFLCVAIQDYLSALAPGEYDVLPDSITSLWPNINRRGEYHRPHRHNAIEHAVVGTYYVQVPPNATQEDGTLTLLDPRNTVGGSNRYRRLHGECDVRLAPRPGYLVLFPPHVMHYVTPHASDVPRISISFNVGIDALDSRRPHSAACQNTTDGVTA